MARHATADAEVSVTPIRLTTPEIAEKIYMPDEVSPYVLRVLLEQLKDTLNERVTEQQRTNTALTTELQRVHNTQNTARDLVERDVQEIQLTMVELVGRDGKSGMVYGHKGQLKTIFTKLSDLKTKYWQLALGAVSFGSACAAVGKYFL